MDNNERLSEGWSRKVTAQGRTFFVNHTTKTTHWELPAADDGAAVAAEEMSPQNDVASIDANAAFASAANHLSSAFQGFLPSVRELKETVDTFASSVSHEIGKSEVFQEIREKNAPLAAFLGQGTSVEHDEEADLEREAAVYRHRTPIGKLAVTLHGAVGLCAESPYVKARCEGQLLTSVPERHGSLDSSSFSFEVYGLGGDLYLTILDRTNWGKAGFGDAALGRVVVPLSSLLTPFFGLAPPEKVWVELRPMHLESLMGTDPKKYYEVVDATLGTGLARPEHTLGFLELELVLTLEEPLLPSYWERPPHPTRVPDPCFSPGVCMVRHIVRLQEVSRVPGEALRAFLQGGVKVQAGLVLLAAYVCFVAPLWQYPLLLAGIACGLGIVLRQHRLASAVLDGPVSLWEDQIEDLGRSRIEQTNKLLDDLAGIQRSVDVLASTCETSINLLDWSDPAVTLVGAGFLGLAAIVASGLLFYLAELVHYFGLAVFVGTRLVIFLVVVWAVAIKKGSHPATMASSGRHVGELASSSATATAAAAASMGDVSGIRSAAVGEGGEATVKNKEEKGGWSRPIVALCNLATRIPDRMEMAHRRIAAEQVVPHSTVRRFIREAPEATPRSRRGAGLEGEGEGEGAPSPQRTAAGQLRQRGPGRRSVG